jgi:hypothetical protein
MLGLALELGASVDPPGTANEGETAEGEADAIVFGAGEASTP